MRVQRLQCCRRLLPISCTLATLLVAATAASLAGYRSSVAVVDAAPRAPRSGVTIRGRVRGLESQAVIEGRTVEAINMETDERQRESTSSSGGFTFKLRPGKYRVQLMLRSGEALTEQPGIIDVNSSEAGAGADFVIGVPRTSLPSDPARSAGSSLGPPIA